MIVSFRSLRVSIIVDLTWRVLSLSNTLLWLVEFWTMPLYAPLFALLDPGLRKKSTLLSVLLLWRKLLRRNTTIVIYVNTLSGM